MAYLSYEEYQSKGGALSEAAFLRFSATAERHVNRLTHDRIVGEATVRDAVKLLMFDLIELLTNTYEFTSAGLKSAGNGSASASYATPKEIRAYIAKLAADYLAAEETADGISLMYAGVDDL